MTATTMTISPPSAFRRSMPLLITHFINQAGDVGLSLLPMLLVARALSPHESSLVMILVKLCVSAGIFLGGWSSDWLGMRRTLLFSFIFAAVGMGFLPFSSTFLGISAAASIAQLGQAMFLSPSRVFLSNLVSVEQRQEALAWLRIANNAGAVFVYMLGSFFSGIGFLFLMLFDCATSLMAAVIGLRILPSSKMNSSHPDTGPKVQREVQLSSSWTTFLFCSVALSGYSLLYNFCYVSLAARMQLQMGTSGLSHFARLMLLSTAMCAILTVPTSRLLKSRRVGLLSGVGFVSLGTAMALGSTEFNVGMYAGVGILTLGEIVFNAVAQPMLVELTPSTVMPGRAHATGLVIQSLGRASGAALAFPLAIYGNNWHGLIGIVGASTLFLSMIASVKPNVQTEE